MLVYVNNSPVSIFAGATALDAARRYCANEGTALPPGELYDAWGNVIAPDSPMADGRAIYTTSPRATLQKSPV